MRSPHPRSRPVRPSLLSSHLPPLPPSQPPILTPPHTGLTLALERASFEVHTELEDPSLYDTPPLESLPGAPAARDAAMRAQLQAVAASETKRALTLMCSHVGGHKFAGNVIVSRLVPCYCGQRVG